nr:MAG TPA: hypothetical protein [Caudoviricetes sp.]
MNWEASTSIKTMVWASRCNKSSRQMEISLYGKLSSLE